MRYTAEVTREGRWWMVAVPEIDGLTQARRLGEIGLMARELIAVTTGAEVSEVAVTVHIRSVGSVTDVDARLKSISNARVEASRLEHEASRDAAALARDLVDQEIPLRDVGAILGVSHQRAHQLVTP
jgi:hypothetical protein